jgi:signal transduction histidine kinase
MDLTAPKQKSPAPAIERPLPGGRRVLWIGFGSILIVMSLIGVDVVQALRTANDRNAALMKSFRARDQILDELRNTMIRSGTTTRDYVFESDPAKAAAARSELVAARKRTEDLMDDYDRQDDQLDPSQRKAYADLRASVGEYWRSLETVLAWDPAMKESQWQQYRTEQAGPLRSQVLSLSSRITLLNEQQLDSGERLIHQEHVKLRNRLVLGSVFGIAICAALAFIVSIRIRQLESTAERQYNQAILTRRELRELAGRLENVQEEERKRLSRELHDEVGQSMSAMLVELSRLESLLPDDRAIHERLAAFRSQAEISVKSLRDIALLLRPSMLDDLGLVAALKWQAREVARRTGMRVRVDAADGTDELPDSHRTCIYRIVQEALNNCAKHAKATAARVIVKDTSQALEVTIQDDGEGFDPTEKGLGLIGMEERVVRLKGALRVDSIKGHGTVISVLLPVTKTTERVQVS